MLRLYHAAQSGSITSGNHVTLGTTSITLSASRLNQILREETARTLRKTGFRENWHDLSLTTTNICRIFAKENFLMAVSLISLTTLAVR
jgi:hypothetical protein